MAMNMFVLASELYKLQPHCKKCGDYPHTVVDPNSPTEVHMNPHNKNETATIGKRLMKHESGLCYYHLRKLVGMFDIKFPLEDECKTIEQMWHQVKLNPMLKI